MEQVFEIASKISTPLALAGFLSASFFFIAKQIINRRIVNASSSSQNIILKLIIKYLFILALVAMILGFCGFIFIRVYVPVDDDKTIIQGIVLVNGKETPNIEVKLLEVEKTTQTNYYGKFRIVFSSSEKEDRYNLSFKGSDIRDTIIEVKNDSLPKKYFFNSNQFGELKKTSNQDLKDIQKKDASEQITVSIQLPKKSKGYNKIFVDGDDANILEESTSYNPRILISVDPTKSQEIIISTNNLDTCHINRIFPKKESNSVRIIPNCY